MSARARSLLSLLLILATIGGVGWLDYSLLLDNPAELEQQTQRLLERTLGEYRPSFRTIRIDLPEKVELTGFRLHRPNSDEVMVRADSVELAFGWFGPRSVLVRGAAVATSISTSLDQPASEPIELPDIDLSRIPAALQLTLVDSQVQVHDTLTGASHLLSVDKVEATVGDGLTVDATGRARYGLLIGPEAPDFAIAEAYPGGSGELRRLELLPHIAFSIRRRRSGRLEALIDTRGFRILKSVRAAMPPFIQTPVWDELNPAGTVNGQIELVIADGDLRYTVRIQPQGASCKLKAFPYRVEDVYGDFAVINKTVMWENVTGKPSGGGWVKGRGAVYIGPPEETVSIFAQCSFGNVPIDETVDAAVKAADDGAWNAYSMFNPRGLATGRLIVARGPEGGAPSISIECDELGGKVHARYSEVPINARNFRGDFRLMEGGVVEIEDARFDFEGGGSARVKGRILRDELLFLDVRARGVPVRAELIAKLPPKVRDYVDPIRPRGGIADARVLIAKARPDAPVLPAVDVRFRDVVVEPKIFPHAVTTSGDVQVRLSVPDGTKDSDGVEPLVTLALNARGRSVGGPDGAPAIVAAVAGGTLAIRELRPEERRPGGPGAEFTSDLRVSARSVRVDGIRDALPAPLDGVVELFDPRGTLENVELHLEGFDHVRFAADGRADLSACYREFPWRVHPERIAVRLDDGRVRLDEVRGRTPDGGRYEVSGQVLLPEGARPAIAELRIDASRIAPSAELFAALPEAVRDPVKRLAPSGGRVAMGLDVSVAPGLTADGEPLITGLIDFEDLDIQVMNLLPEEQRFTQRRLLGLAGRLRLEEDRLVIEEARGGVRLPRAPKESEERDGAPAELSRVLVTGTLPRTEAAARRQPIAFVTKIAGIDAGPWLAKDIPAAARPALEEYQPRGPLDVVVRLVQRADGEWATGVRLLPRGLEATSRRFGAYVRDLRGVIALEDGDPRLVELDGRLGGSRFELRRSVDEERDGPEGWMRFLVRLRGLDFRGEDLARLPKGLKSLARSMDPKGLADLTAIVSVPPDPEVPVRWLVEMDTPGLAATTGVRLNDIRGSVSLSGTTAERTMLTGGLELARVSWLGQSLRDLRGAVQYDGSIVSARNLRAGIHGGRFTGFSVYDSAAGEMRSRFDLQDLSFARLVQSVNDYVADPDAVKELPRYAVTGRVNARATLLTRRGKPPAGFGSFTLIGSNIIPVPVIFRLTRLLQAEGKSVGSFEEIQLSWHLEGEETYEEVVIDRGVLRSDTLDLECVGRIRIAGEGRGEIDMIFLPIDPTDRIKGLSWLTRLLKYQITSIRATGTLADPSVSWIPLRGFFDALEVFGESSAELFRGVRERESRESRARQSRAKEESDAASKAPKPTPPKPPKPPKETAGDGPEPPDELPGDGR